MHLRRLPLQAVSVGFLIAVATTAATATSANLAARQQGTVVLPNTTDYDWWYGCSPTSAGMIMGHYDRNGYGSQHYQKTGDDEEEQARVEDPVDLFLVAFAELPRDESLNGD